MNLERLHWLDIAKGLLIISVLLYHIPIFAKQNGIDNFIWMFYARPWFKYYFMPAFFIITGFCSSFERKTLWKFVKKNFKLLILPGFLVSIGTPIGSHLLHRNTQLLYYWIPIRDFFYTGGFWFLTSLFFGKIIYFSLCKISRSSYIRGGGTLLLLVIGVVMRNQGVANVWFIENTMCLCIFFWIGEILSQYHKKLLEKKMILIYSIIYFPIAYLPSLYNINLPFVTLHVSINYLYIPLFLILSVSGSMMLLSLSKLIGTCSVIEYIGKRTLVIYIFHMYILLSILPYLVEKIPQGFIGSIIGVVLILYTILICLGVDFVLNNRYLKWFLGKF